MLSNKEIKNRSREIFLNSQWPTVGANTVSGLILGAAAGVTYGAGSIIVGGPLTRGLSKYYLKLVRNEEKKFEMIFDGFKEFGRNLGTYALNVLYLLLWSLLIIPIFIKSFSYSMVYFLMEDNDGLMGNEAITMSRKIMNGYKWRLFCLEFRFIGWILLSVLTFGVLAILYVEPWMNTAKALFYEELKKEREGKTELE